MKTISEIDRIISENGRTGRDTFAGLTAEEISRRNRATFDGEDGIFIGGDEAFPDDQDEWSSWTD
jgi:hypothetical protein